MKKFIIISLIMLVFATIAFAQMQSFWIKGYKYYSLYAICQQKGIEYEWDSVGRVATLKKNGIEARIRAGSDKILVNDKDLKDIGPPLYFYNGTVVIPSSFANRGIDRIFKSKVRSKSYTARKKKSIHVHTIKTIVIDPGHGGKDPGAIGKFYKLKEKDIALDVAKRLKRSLSGAGIKVYLTRSRDVFIPLWKRVDFANKKGANLFISIHANASWYRKAKGFEVYYLSDATDDNAKALAAAENAVVKFENGSMDRYNMDTNAIAWDLKFTENRIESKELANYLTKAVKGKISLRKNPVKGARFLVLKNTEMPAILVEVGFVSNRKEEALLRTSSHRDKIAQRLARGVLSYKDKYDKANGFTR